jgi:microcystin-dependent protein
MSFRRAQRRTVNQNTYLDNRLTTFTNPHIYDGDLHVERDQTIGGNLTIGKDLRAVNFYATGNYFLDTFVLIPAGTIIMSAAVAEPGGWLDCDGRLFNITVHPDLFTSIGYSFGGFDNSFNLPDMRGRVGVGLGQGTSLTNRSLADVSGAETHTLTIPQMPSHNHGVTDPGHAHSYVNNTNDQNTDNAFSTETAADQVDIGQTTGTSTTGISIQSTGGGAAHNNMQPFVVLRYLIKY